MKKSLILLLIVLFASIILPSDRDINKSFANIEMGNYCYAPPSIATTVPPLVMLVMGRDHKLYYEAYNDASDLDGDGKLDVGYKHSIYYYGYFDPYICYSYDGSKFVPSYISQTRYCNGSTWSGNFLNWLTMSRIDVLKKVLFGGNREADNENETVLAATYIPQDAHSWGKEVSSIEGERSYVPNINSLTPLGNPASGTRHLFCVVSKSDASVPVIRVLTNKTNRSWEWASKERPVCDDSLGTPTEYNVKVKVCDSTVAIESNCKKYCSSSGGNCTYKPIGLLQKYGEYEGGGKWCSKSLKSCNADSDCNISTDGLCVDKAKMYFGLLTGSYTKNLSGGVLRKNIWTIQDELNPNNGIFQSSENVPGNIILTLNRMKVIGFRYSDHSYQDSQGGTCGWITNHPLAEGECRMWGNPIAEMMYEALRYLAGKGTPTSSFTYSGAQDSGLNLSKPNWGIQKGSTYHQPYQLFPICAKPFMLVLSDINTNYESDSLPGSYFGGITGDLSGLNVSTRANTISTTEGISGNYFIGQSGSLYDFICSPKNVTGFSNIRGLCPEEPTKQGSYYSASVAYYGNTAFKDNFTGTKPFFNVKTYSVALASPIPDIAIKVGDNTVRISPFAKSVSGCLDVNTNCAQKCTLTRDVTGKLTISNCQTKSFCPTNQIVDFYVEQMNYDSNNNLTYAKFRINFEDVEQGADHDMDAIILYEITPVGNNQIRVKLTSDYAAGCIDQVLGFFISGTTEDGQWLVVKDKDVSGTDGDTPAVVANMPLTWERTFTVSVSGSAAGQLKNPLWYAAKWGGFNDHQINNNIPDLQSEWDKDGDENPDTYFFVVNPLKMEQELEKAFSDILKRASSGSTVATLASRTGISSLVIQPYYYPKYLTETGTEISWIGFLRSIWVDLKQNFREDTVANKILDMAESTWDKIIQFVTSDNETKIAVLEGDTDSGSNACTLENFKDLNQIIPVFNSGCWLANVDANSRNIKYNKNGVLTDFKTSEASYLAGIWDDIDSTINTAKAQCIIRYLKGENLLGDTSCNTLAYVKRPRELNINAYCGSNQTKTWKLGDIIHSTPSVTSDKPLNFYHLRYGDTSYLSYVRDEYKNRPSHSFVGANDGMLHAFRIGTIINQTDANQPSKLQNSPTDTGTDKIGREEWAFIPKNALPYLLWYGHYDYCHIPTIDYRTIVFDASINGTANSTKSASSWRTILVGVMGFGGKKIDLGSGNVYSSSIFVLDLTDWLNDSDTYPYPTLLWETTLPDNTLTTSFPTIVRLGDKNNNGDWYVVIGTGPTGPEGATFANAGKLYFYDLRAGTLINTLTVNTGSALVAIGDIYNVDVDDDYQDDVIYFGAYGKTTSNYVWGNFYRLSLRSGSSYRTISSLTNSNIENAVNLSTFKTGNYQPPVFAAPAFTSDDIGNLWVFFGTGKFLNNDDKSIPYTNYLIGYKDPYWNSTGAARSKGDLVDVKSVLSTTTIPYLTEQECICDNSGCSFRDFTYYKTQLSGTVTVTNGWYYSLTGEAIISQPFLYAEMVNTLVFIPPGDICEYSGRTRYVSLYYNLLYEPNTTIVINQIIGYGSPPLGQPFQTLPSGKLIVQTSAGTIIKLPTPTVLAQGKFVTWIEK